MDNTDARQFLANYIFVASLFLLVGIILILVKEYQPKRTWKRCVHGHWAVQEEYCPEPGCGLSLAPVPEAQQKRIEYVAGHQVTRCAMADPVMRYHFSLWLIPIEQEDNRQYGLDIALMMYRTSWKLRETQGVAEEISDSDTD